MTKQLLPYVATVLLTATIIYLTPLKWVTVVTPTINDIDPKAFQSDFVQNSDKYIFIDVRSQAEYNKSHAVGSINMPLHTLYDQRRVLPKNGKKIILICGGGRASGVAYSYLQHYGFFNIKRISGGMIDWVAEGLPTASSTNTLNTL